MSSTPSMLAPFKRIAGYPMVLQAFGAWPRFHDAEVRSLVLDRNSRLSDGVSDARLELCLHAMEWTRDAPPRFNHHLVRIRFHDVQELLLEGFNHQNALLELKIEDAAEQPQAGSGLCTTLIPAHGLSGTFCAAGAEVLSVVPCDENGEPRSVA